jgi:predicted component of type VI protein secretion system
MYPGLSLGQYYGVYKIPKETTKEGLAKNADTYIKLITNIIDKNTGLNSSDLQSLLKVKDRLEKLKNGETIKHNKLINDLNAIIAEEKFSLSAVGDGFEIALGVISEVLNGKAVDTIDELTKEVWTGSERSSVQIDATKFQEGLLGAMQESLKNAGQHTLPLDEANGVITYNAT